MSQQQLPRVRPVHGDPEVPVDRVVGAARSELARRQHLSLRTVARRAGVDLREVTRHVGTADELVRRVLAEVTADAHETMAAFAPGSSAASCRDRLLAYARGYRCWALTHPAEFALLLGPTARGSRNEPVAARGVAWFHFPLLEILRDGLDRGEVDLDAAAATGRSQPALRPGLLASDPDLDPRLALAFVTLSAGLHGHLVLEASGQLAAVFVDLDRAFDAQVRSLVDAAGIA